MSILKTRNEHIWHGVRPFRRQYIFDHPHPAFCLTIVAVVFAWIAQILFWRLVGWEVSYRMDLSWVALPIGCYFCAAVAIATSRSTARSYLCRLFPAWLPELGWVALVSALIAFGIVYQSIILFGFAAGLFGAGLFPIMRQARLFFNRGRPKIALIGATFFGVAVGVIATRGNLFADQQLLQLAIAFTCCLTIAVTAMRLLTMLTDHDEIPPVNLPDHARQPPLSDSFIQAGCGVMIAVPIAVAPTLEALCGIGLAGFSFGYMTHYGAMLLPSFFVDKWRHTFSNYALTGAYVVSMAFGHVLPLLYLARVDWW